jgi:hypothetical protein
MNLVAAVTTESGRVFAARRSRPDAARALLCQVRCARPVDGGRLEGRCPPYAAPVPDDQGLVSSVLVAGPAARLKTSRLVMYPECSLPPHGSTTASPAAEISSSAAYRYVRLRADVTALRNRCRYSSGPPWNWQAGLSPKRARQAAVRSTSKPISARRLTFSSCAHDTSTTSPRASYCATHAAAECPR